MLQQTIAKRYAKALLDIAIDDKKISIYKEQLQEFKSALTNKDNQELHKALNSPKISRYKKEDLLTGLREVITLDKPVFHIILLLLRRSRINLLVDFIDKFDDMCKAELNEKSVTLISAVSLKADSLGSFAKRLSELKGGKYQVNNIVDEKIVGGYVLRDGNKEYDWSIASNLSMLRKKICEGL
ncbi:MAG: ATP synthase F1 subunit delta [SAR324 cluster bacterium]|nr:ATP synthase F1 subunit delta [SAR324 cluster bacterium]